MLAHYKEATEAVLRFRNARKEVQGLRSARYSCGACALYDS